MALLHWKSNGDDRPEKWTPFFTHLLDDSNMEISAQNLIAALARIMLGLLFLLSGIGQLTAPANTIAYIVMNGVPLPRLSYVAALALELGLGIALLLGYHTRFVAAALAAFTILTALVFHNRVTDIGQLIHFLKNIAIAGGLLHIYAFGGGGISLDALISANNSSAR